ncbi:MAG TPA: hypothetical protein VGZ00_08120 [Candidatus Baltobacteraceae bacterium]|jgi:hypothetical protein|nr:hypothetical protein [Candidatus Baltobacteraceae bacterium]
MKLSDSARRKILNPEPGSALARARDYGIDLTLVARNVAMTPDERLDSAVRSQIMARTLREIRENAKHK